MESDGTTTWLDGIPQPVLSEVIGGLGPAFGSIGAAMKHVRSTASDRMARSTLDRNAVRGDVIEDYECDCRSLSLHLRSGRSLSIFIDGNTTDWRLHKARPVDRCAAGPALSREYRFKLQGGRQFTWLPYDLLDEQLGVPLAGVSACARFFYFQCDGMEEVMVMPCLAVDYDEAYLRWGYA